MSNEKQQTKIQAAEGKLEAAKNRIEEIKARLEEAKNEIDKQGHELGKVAAAGQDTKKVHSRISSLKMELEELKAEKNAIWATLSDLEEEFTQARAEAAAETVEILSKELTPRGLRIFKQLDQLHLELCELERIENNMKEAQKVAGHAAKPLPVDTVTVPLGRVWKNIIESIEETIRDNGFDFENNRLAAHGANINLNRRGEYGTDREIEKVR